MHVFLGEEVKRRKEEDDVDDDCARMMRMPAGTATTPAAAAHSARRNSYPWMEHQGAAEGNLSGETHIAISKTAMV